MRTFLRPFRGVHKYYLADYVATYETIVNAKRITPAVIQRMCFGGCLHTQTSEGVWKFLVNGKKTGHAPILC